MVISGISSAEMRKIQQSQAQQKQRVKKEEKVSFWDERWTGHQIEKLTGENAITDWLQNKDKVCTDGKDDGKIGFWEGTKSLAKGLLGGIPKAMINHPIATVLTIAGTSVATVLTGGAILPVLGAAGVAMGVGMAGYGGYKAATAKTDGEAKQALETLGMGVTTTALSVASAGKTLEKAAEAGVKPAQINKDANVFQKTIQMFKSIPESLKMSKSWVKSYIKGTPVNIELADGRKQVKVKGKVVEETSLEEINRKYKKFILREKRLEDGTLRRYDGNGALTEESLADGTLRRYDDYGVLKEEILPDGTYRKYSDSPVTVENNSNLPSGTRVVSYDHYGVDGDFTGTYTQDGYYKVVDNRTGKIIDGKFSDGTEIRTYNSGNDQLTKTTLKDGSYKIVNTKTGNLVESKSANMVAEEQAAASTKFKAEMEDIIFEKLDNWNGKDGRFEKVTNKKDGTYKIRDLGRSGKTVEYSTADGTIKRATPYGYETVKPNSKKGSLNFDVDDGGGSSPYFVGPVWKWW